MDGIIALDEAISYGKKNFLPKVSGAAIRAEMLPGQLRNIWSYNGNSNIQDNLWTDGGFQYAVWVNAARSPIIGKRALPDGDWQTFDMSTVSGNPLAAPVAEDGHNYIAVAVDSAGYIHVAGNTHNQALRYMKSNSPRDITSWTAQPYMVSPGGAAVQEDAFAYPTFVMRGDGKLLFTYRYGNSGAGDQYLNVHDPVTGTWSRLAYLFGGIVSSESAYLNRVGVSPVDGSIHIFMTWRGSGDANTNTDICHVVSYDGGATWKNIQTGATLTLPITHATVPKAFTVPINSGLLNQNGADVDTLGRPHAVFMMYDAEYGTPTNLRHVWWDGAWHNDKVTNLTYSLPTRLSIVNGQISRPTLLCTKGGRTLICYRSQFDGKRGTLRLIDVTPSGTPGAATSLGEFPIFSGDLYAYEPTFDSHALRTRDELSMLITPVMAPDRTDWVDDTLWAAQWGAVLTVDLAQLDGLVVGAARRPAITPLTSASIGTALSVTSSTRAAITGAPLVPLDQGSSNRVCLARVTVRGALSATGTGKVALSVVDGAGTTTSLFEIPFTSTSPVLNTTVWVPVDRSFLGPDVVLTLSGEVSTGTMTISAATIEVGTIMSMSGVPLRAQDSFVPTPIPAVFKNLSTAKLHAIWDVNLMRLPNAAKVSRLPEATGRRALDQKWVPYLSSVRPTLVHNNINGQKVLDFAGASSMRTDWCIEEFGPTFEVIAVVRAQTSAVDQAAVAFDAGGSLANGRIFQLGYASGGNARAIGFSTTASATIDTQPTDLAMHIVEMRRTATAVRVTVDGVSDGETASSGTAATFNPANVIAITLGSTQSASSPGYFTGKIAFVAIVKGLLTDTERAAIRAELATRYALTVS